MRKLNLQLGSIKEMLTKEQMKKVCGGYSGCTIHCQAGDYEGGDIPFESDIPGCWMDNAQLNAICAYNFMYGAYDPQNPVYAGGISCDC